MRHITFWVFQMSVVLGVIFMSVAIFGELQLPTQAREISANQEVLARSTYSFAATAEPIDSNEVLARVNSQRILAGLASLQANAELEQIAQQRADDMQREAYYAHQSPVTGEQFSDILRQKQVGYRSACENLDMTFYTQTDAIVEDWLQSNAGHRECLLAPYASQAGYAVSSMKLDGNQIAYIVVAIHLSE